MLRLFFCVEHNFFFICALGNEIASLPIEYENSFPDSTNEKIFVKKRKNKGNKSLVRNYSNVGCLM